MSSMASALLADRRRQAVEPDRAAAELVDDRAQQPAIEVVEAVRVHFEQLQRRVRDVERDRARRRAPPRSRARAAAAGSRRAACRASGRASSRAASASSATPRMRAERRTISSRSAVGVEVEPVHDPESRAQRRGQQPRPRRRADERERLERHLHRSRARALADHDVELEVLHRGIEDLLDGRRQAVNLVDEQHLALARGR